MTRLLLLTLVFAPDSVSTANLMTDLALGLQRLGHEITVLTTTPHYNLDSEVRTRHPLRRRWGGVLYESELNGLRIWHAAIPAKGSRVAARLLDYLWFHVVSVLTALLIVGPQDIVLTPSPPLTIGLSAWLLGRLKRIPFIYNVQEIYPDIAVRLGVLRNRSAVRFLERIEQFIYSRARVIVVISEWFRRALIAKGAPADKVRVIPNFVDTEFMRPGDRHNGFSREHGLDGSFVVLYAGNIGLTQGFETILDAARRLAETPVLRLLIVGDGARRAWLEAQLAAQPLPNVTLLPYQPRSRVPDMYATSDVCLVPLKRGAAQSTFPSKIYSIMAAGRPAIVSADPDTELACVVAQADCGLTVPPEDPEALARALLDAYRDQAALHQWGANGRRYVLQHHSAQAVVSAYHELIASLS